MTITILFSHDYNYIGNNKIQLILNRCRKIIKIN